MSTTETLPFTTAPSIDPYKLGHDGRRRRPDDGGAGRNYSTAHGEGGPASKRVIVAYGFWIFLLSALVMFSAFFSAHSWRRSATACGPSRHELCDATAALLQSVLARARDHLGRVVQDRLSDGRRTVSYETERNVEDVGPGVMGAATSVREGILGYVIGLVLAALLTAASFAVIYTNVVWGPAIPAALITLAVAQMGVHLVFFLHLTTAPDNTNNAMALAFGVLIVALIIGGSLWIMDHLNHNMAPMHQMRQIPSP